MKNKLLPLSISLILIIIFIIFFKGLQNSNIYAPEVKISIEISSFSADLLYSNKAKNSLELFGSDKYYLLNIWSSWCVPCRQEHSLLMDLNANKKIIVVGLNYKDTKRNAKFFLDELGNPYKNIIFDQNGINAIEWGAYGVPESFLIHNGKILRKYIGPLNKDLIKEIKSII